MMGFEKSIPLVGIVTSILLPTLGGSVGLLSLEPARASSEWQVSVNFPKPSGGTSQPDRTIGGGSREAGSTCVAKGEGVMPMMALMPFDNIGTTVDADPNLFLYVPITTAKVAEVIIEDEDFNEVYVKSDFEIPEQLSEKAGIVKLSLEEANLEANKTYYWTAALVCNANDRSQDEVVEGFFERAELDASLQTEIEQATPLEKAELYADAGLWNETVTIVAGLRSSNQAEWMELLESVGLESIAQAPLIE